MTGGSDGDADTGGSPSEAAPGPASLPTPAPPTPPAATPRWYQRRPVSWSGPGFPRVVIAWVFSNLADSALYLMLAVWVKDLTGSDGAAAVVFALLGLPALIAPSLGQLADRYSRRRVLGIAKTFIAGCVLTLFLVDGPGWVWLIYIVVFLYGSMNYLTAAAQAGLVRDLLRDDQLASGNGLLATIDQVMRLVAPLIGAGLYAMTGPGTVLGLTAGCFLVAAAMLLSLRAQESPPQTRAERGSRRQEILAGFGQLRQVPTLGRLTLLMSAGFAAVGLVNVAVFPVLEQGLGLEASALGLLVSVQGVGAVVAGMLAAWAIKRLGEQRTFGIGMTGLGLGVLSLATGSLPVVLLGLVFVGAGITWVVVSFTTYRQRTTPPRLQGRTASATNVAVNLPQTLVTLVAAGLIGILDHRILVVVTAVGVLVTAWFALAAARRSTEKASKTS